MPTIVNIPDVGHVSFPDSMDVAAIEAASAKLHSEAKSVPRGTSAPATAPGMIGDARPGRHPKDSLGGPPARTATGMEQFGKGVTSGVLTPFGPPIQGTNEAVERVKGIPAGLLQTAQGLLSGDPETLGTLIGSAPFASAIRLPPGTGNVLKAGSAAAKGAAKGAVRGGMAPTAIRLRGVPLEVPVPASVAGATAGASAGAFIGGPAASTIGAIVGGGAPIVKGAIQGAKTGLKDFRAAQAAANRAPRVPIWDGDGPRPSPGMPGEKPAPAPAPTASFTGRKPGGIQNQVAPDKFKQLQQSLKPAENTELLDGVAQGLGYKKFSTIKDPAAQATIKAVAERIDKREVKPASPQPDTGPTHFGQLMERAIANLKETGQIPKDWEPSGKMEGPARFEEGHANSPLIDSSKSRFNKPVANPGMLKTHQVQSLIRDIEKLPNPGEGKIALLSQLRQEATKRGLK